MQKKQSESNRGVEKYSCLIRGVVVCFSLSPETPERERVDLAAHPWVVKRNIWQRRDYGDTGSCEIKPLEGK